MHYRLYSDEYKNTIVFLKDAFDCYLIKIVDSIVGIRKVSRDMNRHMTCVKNLNSQCQ